MAAAVCDEFGGGVHHLRGASARIGEAQVHDSFDELAVGSGSSADVHEGLADAGKGVHQELCGDLGVGNLRGSWQRRIDEYYRGDRLRAGGRLQDRDGTAHRVTHQNDWAAEGFVDEAVEYLRCWLRWWSFCPRQVRTRIRAGRWRSLCCARSAVAAILTQFRCEPPNPCTMTMGGTPAGPPKSTQCTGPAMSLK